MEMLTMVLMSMVMLPLCMLIGMQVAEGMDDSKLYEYISKVYQYVRGSKVGMWINEYKVEMGMWCGGMVFISIITLVVPALL